MSYVRIWRGSLLKMKVVLGNEVLVLVLSVISCSTWGFGPLLLCTQLF